MDNIYSADYYNRSNMLLYEIKMAPMKTKDGPLFHPAFHPTECFAISPYFPGYLVGNYGTIYDMVEKVILQPKRDKRGYQKVFLKNYGNIPDFKFAQFVHRMVMLAHHPDREKDQNEVNHIKKLVCNNYYNPYDKEGSRLEWCSHVENMQKAIEEDKRRGRGFFKDAIPYSNDDIRLACSMVMQKKTNREIAQALNIPFDKAVHLVASIMRPDIRYRQDIVDEFPNLERRIKDLEDSAIHRACELISTGMYYQEIYRVMQEEGYTISERTIRNIAEGNGKVPRAAEISKQYDMENRYIRDYFRPTEDQINTIIQMAINMKSNAEIAKAIGATINQVCSVIDSLRKGRNGIYLKDKNIEIPNIPRRANQMDEPTIRRSCELISQGYSYSDIFAAMKSEGYSISVNTIKEIATKGKHIKAWLPIIDQYDFSNRNIPEPTFSPADQEVEMICQMLIQGKSHKEVYIAMNMEGRVRWKKFTRWCGLLKKNEYVAYKHISSKYFN